MQPQTLQHRIDQLNQRIRVLILQNAHEEEDYDERFLCEIKQLADEVLRLKERVRKFNRTYTGANYQKIFS